VDYWELILGGQVREDGHPVVVFATPIYLPTFILPLMGKGLEGEEVMRLASQMVVEVTEVLVQVD
jgi:hypothetical protein